MIERRQFSQSVRKAAVQNPGQTKKKKKKMKSCKRNTLSPEKLSILG